MNRSELSGSDSHEQIKEKRYPSVFPLTDEDKVWIEQKISSMSLYEKCAQMVMAPVYENYLNPSSPDYDSTMTLVKKNKIGGLIMFRGTLRQEIDFIKKARNLADIPLLISADYENGLGDRIDDALEFPHAMSLGATLNSYYSYLVGRAVSEESRLIGINQNFAPVLDINNNFLNPVINIRSFSESKFTVSELASSFILGTKHGRVISTAKHFPGHGNTEIDSHTDLPIINGSAQYLLDNELFPFVNAIKHGVQSIMIGHLEVPALDTLPASLSKKIVTDLLQNQLGFDGLIVTDAFNMQAITKMFSLKDAILLGVNAGDDIILMPPKPVEAIRIIYDAVKSGEISMERIDNSIKKILSAKRWLKIESSKKLSTDAIIDSVNNGQHQKLADMIAEASITLVKNDTKIIPVDMMKYEDISCVTVTDGKGEETSKYFQNILQNRFSGIKTYLINNTSKPEEYKNIISSVNNSDLIFLPVFIDVKKRGGNEKLRESQVDLIKSLLTLRADVILISFKSPYLPLSIPESKTFLNTYSYSYASQNAGLKAILGEIDIRGKLPVSIPGTDLEIGDGIVMEKSKETKLKIKLDNNLFSMINPVAIDMLKKTGMKNINLCTGKNGKIVYQNSFENSSGNPASTLTIDKNFDLGNLTAPIALTSAVMLLIKDKLLLLDDRVRYYIPGFRNTDKQDITVKNLLMHNSGFKSEFDSLNINWNKTDLINSIIKSDLLYKSGMVIRYSELNDIVLQFLIERISGKKLFDFLNEKLFKPLGMKNTYVNEKSYNSHLFGTNNFRYGNSINRNEILKNILGGFTGTDALYSNLKDLAVFAQMLTQNGYYDGRQYFTAPIIDDITSLLLPVSYTNWQTVFTKNNECENLSANGFGYYSDDGNSLWIDKKNKLFFILLTDRNNKNMIASTRRMQCEIIRIIDERK